MSLIHTRSVPPDIGFRHFQSRRFLQSIPEEYWSDGWFFSLLPTDCSDSKAIRLEEGGLFKNHLSKSDKHTIVRIESTFFNLIDILLLIRSRCGGFQVYLRDPFDTDNQSKYKIIDFSCGHEYDFLAKAVDDMRETWSFGLWCGEMDTPNVDRSLAMTTPVFACVNAYDGESFNCWISEKYLKCSKIDQYISNILGPASAKSHHGAS